MSDTATKNQQASPRSDPESWDGFSEAILDWFDLHGRALPWRLSAEARQSGKRPDPYQVWLCEIIMQQTTIPHGAPYFERFRQRWPSVEALAHAADEDVMAAWAGLGYYARARNLLKCAREITANGGAFPQTAKALQALPGIGPYTAGAIASIAFGEPVAAVDGNVERVFSRLMALKGEWKQEKKRIKSIVSALVPPDRPGAFAEALMDLGATICTPKSPNCLICPVSDFCAARAQGEPERFPIKPIKSKLPQRKGHIYLLKDGDQILLERRPEQGLLGGMLAFPTSDWPKSGALPDPDYPATADWIKTGEVRHVFTHFALTLTVWSGQLSGMRPDGEWMAIDSVTGLPTVFAKAFRLAHNID